jgi:AraC-like DNA-binding protein
MEGWLTINNLTGLTFRQLKEWDRSFKSYDSFRYHFKKVYGESPRTVFDRARIDKAKRLLLDQSVTIKDLTRRFGYAHQHEFSRFFRKQTGTSPSEWRKSPDISVP